MIGRFGTSDPRQLVTNEAMFLVQRVEGMRERGDGFGCGQEAQGVPGGRRVDDDFVVVTALCETDDLTQPDELVDSGNRQTEQRVDVLPIEPGTVLDDVPQRLLVGVQPSGKCAARVDFGRVQRSR